MAIKITKSEVLKYIPKCEKNEEKPTTICYTPMTKKKFDNYIYSLTETVGNKSIARLDKATEALFKSTLAPDENGVYIYNIYYNGQFYAEVKELNLAVDILLNLTDISTANEIEQVLRGASMLTEEEEKN